MYAQNRRSSFSSSTMSSLAKRNATESSGKAGTAASSHQSKNRAPLSNITNQKNGTRSLVSASNLVPCSKKTAQAKKPTAACIGCTTVNGLREPLNVKHNVVVLPKTTFLRRNEENVISFPKFSAPCAMDGSPSASDESMSTSDSFKSPEVEYIDNNDASAIDSIERKTFSKLWISEHVEPKGNICSRALLTKIESDEKVINIDNNYANPQLCATFACDIYKHLRASEANKRPLTDFMERIQKDINASMRAILIDWLVEVAEEYRLIPETLYLTVNYIDRYLSGNTMNRQKLQLLGVACMMIASKYEEICAPQVEEFCYITDNTYFKDEVLEMESSVLNYLKFEMTAPTAKCFLRRFIRAAQGTNEVPSMQLECLANYISELSLLEYSMLRYSPSVIAASAIFLARYILDPSKRPWNSTLQHYSLYRPCDLRECIKELQRLCCDSHTSTLPAVRDKYSQHKYKFVAKKNCPPLIPLEFFED